MNGIWIGLAGAVGIPLLLYVWGLLLPRESTFRWGRTVGSFMSRFGRQRIGVKGWEKFEDRFQSTVADFAQGVCEGLDLDDATN